jgi:nucleotide-binding universal stress UspA family protein
MTPKILVPFDDSPTARKTLEAIINLKERFSKKLTLLYVINSEHLAYTMVSADVQMEMMRKNATTAGENILARAEELLTAAGFEIETILKFGNPRNTIIHLANEEQFQLVVIGRHEGGGEIRDVLFGSVANHVLHNVACPVLLF